MPTQQDVKFSDYVRGLHAASESDLSSGNNFPLVTPDSLKKMGGKNVAKASDVPLFVRQGWVSGYINDGLSAIGDTISLEVVPNGDYKHFIVNVGKGDFVKVTGEGGAAANLICFIDGDNKLVRKEARNKVVTDAVYISPVDGKVIVQSKAAVEYHGWIKHPTEDISKVSYDLESRVNAETFVSLNFSSGYINDGLAAIGDTISLTPVTGQYVFAISNVRAGDFVKVTGEGSVGANLICFTDNENKLVQKAQRNAIAVGDIFVAPVDGKVIINSKSSVVYAASQRTATEIEKYFANKVSQIGETEFTPVSFVVGKYINDGTTPQGDVVDLTPVDSSLYAYAIFDVNEGDLVKVTGHGAVAANLLAFIGNDGRLLQLAERNQISNGDIFVSPASGRCIVNAKVEAPYSVAFKKSTETERYIVDKVSNKSMSSMRAVLGKKYYLEYANSTSQLNIIGYQKNNQNIHPKVLYFARKLFGHKFWLAYTPYPNGDLFYENPCIAYSDDGYNWVNITGNPIDQAADVRTDQSYNADTHLVYRSDNNSLECFYLYADQTTATRKVSLKKRVSYDGINWGDEIEVLPSTFIQSGSFLSPCLIFDASNNKYLIWVVDNNQHVIHYYEMPVDNSSGITLIRDITFSIEVGGLVAHPWHFDVIQVDGKYVMLIMTKSVDDSRYDLFISESANNISYSSPTLVMSGKDGSWDSKIYRSSIVPVEGEFYVYYSAISATGARGMGLTIAGEKWKFFGIN